MNLINPFVSLNSHPYNRYSVLFSIWEIVLVSDGAGSAVQMVALLQKHWKVY